MSFLWSRTHSFTRISCCIQRSGISTSSLRSAVAFKGAPSVGKKRFRLPVCEDAEHLCNFVSGSNYFQKGEDVRIKDDSEYPDWLWTMRVGEAKLEDLDPETTEYWDVLHDMSMARQRRYEKNKPQELMIVGHDHRSRMEYEQRIKYRALASEESEEQLGFRPEDYVPKYDRKLFLKPQECLNDQELYPDEYAAQNQMKFHKTTRAHDVEPVKPVCKMRKRGMFQPF